MLEDALARQSHLPRFLCHMFQRRKQGRLNLVTGAGISVDAKVPNWPQLLERLSDADPQLAEDIKHHKNAGRHPEYLGQIVYHRRRAMLPPDTREDLRQVTAEHDWAEAVHRALYQAVPDGIEEVVQQHPYLSQLRDLARRVPLVINFNFDDLLAAAMDKQIAQGVEGRALSVVWRPPLVERSNVTTVYHVNGVLPRVSLTKRSEQLIFTEDSFAEASARSPGVDAEYTFLRFVQNTMLIIGHSLTDSSLKNYLRRNRDKSPANHHYMIYWLDRSDGLSSSLIQDIFEANLELYNVITIFLTSEEIAQALSLLTTDERTFSESIDAWGSDQRSSFRYYIVGPVAAGKSTLLEHLRCFETHEEWTSLPPPEMYLSFDKLTPEQDKKVNDFIYRELKEKNKRLSAGGVGFHFMDRAPLDLYAFSKTEVERRKKTRDIKNKVTRDQGFVSGEIVFIYAGGETLVRRNLGRGRPPKDSGEAEYLQEQCDALRSIYNPPNVYATDACNAGELARRVARHALLGDYKPVDLNDIMGRYA
jgi:hypothetical protein